MNTRIRELLGQAYDEAVPETWTTLSSEQLGRIYDKFAELIVRECIDIVSPYAIRMENFDGGHPVTDLKKHFGIDNN